MLIVKNTNSMFEGMNNTNVLIHNWKPTSLVEMKQMFKDSSFDNDIFWGGSTKRLKNMEEAFKGSKFNSCLYLSTYLVKNMNGLFMDTKFNNTSITLKSFQVGNVEECKSMFENNKEFNQNLKHFKFKKIKDMSKMFYSADSMIKPGQGKLGSLYNCVLESLTNVKLDDFANTDLFTMHYKITIKEFVTGKLNDIHTNLGDLTDWNSVKTVNAQSKYLRDVESNLKDSFDRYKTYLESKLNPDKTDFNLQDYQNDVITAINLYTSQHR